MTAQPESSTVLKSVRGEGVAVALLRAALLAGGALMVFEGIWAVVHPAFRAPYVSVWWVFVLASAAGGYIASQGRSWRLGLLGGASVAAVDLVFSTFLLSAIRPDLVPQATMLETVLGAVLALLVASAAGLGGACVARLVAPGRPSTYALMLLLVLAGLSGHVLGIWEVPRLEWASSVIPSADGTQDPRSITVAYYRGHTLGANSPWPQEMTDLVMARFVERWSEATLGRSRVTVMDGTDLRDVFVIFSDRAAVGSHPDPGRAAAGRFTAFAGGRIRVIELLVPPRFDLEYTTGTLLHEFGHALGCCTGAGTSDGHFIGRNCTLILCSPHGSARIFSEEELQQMGLGR